MLNSLIIISVSSQIIFGLKMQLLKPFYFLSAEKVYGVKPNAIGDMRYITVPYSLAWLGFKLNYKIDLYKIWKQQSLIRYS
jgi:hypothetical protein